MIVINLRLSLTKRRRYEELREGGRKVNRKTIAKDVPLGRTS